MARNTSGLKRGGSPGRPKGVKSRKTKEMLAFFAELANDPTWQASAEKRILAGKAPHLEGYMLNRIGGKPVERHEVTGANGGPVAVREIRNYLVSDAEPDHAA